MDNFRRARLIIFLCVPFLVGGSKVSHKPGPARVNPQSIPESEYVTVKDGHLNVMANGKDIGPPQAKCMPKQTLNQAIR
ncbi:MAG: hypothetical protein HC896_13865, partial [Bacteroidales bacterium]|nr:hypothetical protein [Bacteroidales bacterium]